MMDSQGSVSHVEQAAKDTSVANRTAADNEPAVSVCRKKRCYIAGGGMSASFERGSR
jgi:hypothetical protein